MAADYLGGGTGSPRRPAGWSVANVPVPDGYAAATALRAPAPHHAVTRTLPEAWLYSEDATELIAAV